VENNSFTVVFDLGVEDVWIGFFFICVSRVKDSE